MFEKPSSARRTVLIGIAGLCSLAVFRRDQTAVTLADQKRNDLIALLEAQQEALGVDGCLTFTAPATGLRGTYFDQEQCRGNVVMRRPDALIDFDASLDLLPAHPRLRPRSVRWEGWLRPLYTGGYRFHSEISEARMVVGGQVLWRDDSPRDAMTKMTAGRLFPVTFEVDRFPTEATQIRLEWTTPLGLRYIVPRELLYLPTDTV